MNIKEMTLEQLKSLAYDLLVQIEGGQQNLRIINQEIAAKTDEPKKPGKA